MLKLRHSLLGAALLAAAFGPSAWAADEQPVQKEPQAATQPAPQQAPVVVKEEAKAGNGAASAEAVAKTQPPVAQPPARRRAVTTAEIDDMNRRYPGG